MSTENSVLDAGSKVPEELRPYTWKPGQSGNPKGRPKTTPLTDALLKALNDKKKSQRIANALIAVASDKESPKQVQAFAEIRDTVEGKPQSDGQSSGPQVLIVVNSIPRPAWEQKLDANS